jgi:hypothetical protein
MGDGGDWTTVHEKKIELKAGRKAAQAAGAMACGGGTEQLAEADEPAAPSR